MKEYITLSKSELNSFQILQEKILDWAFDKNLLSNTALQPQATKVLEEASETLDACINLDAFYESDKVDDLYLHSKLKLEVIDGIGDVFVTLIILAEQLGIHPMECLAHAYEQIAPRTGKTVDGVFIKDA